EYGAAPSHTRNRSHLTHGTRSGMRPPVVDPALLMASPSSPAPRVDFPSDNRQALPSTHHQYGQKSGYHSGDQAFSEVEPSQNTPAYAGLLQYDRTQINEQNREAHFTQQAPRRPLPGTGLRGSAQQFGAAQAGSSATSASGAPVMRRMFADPTTGASSLNSQPTTSFMAGTSEAHMPSFHSRHHPNSDSTIHQPQAMHGDVSGQNNRFPYGGGYATGTPGYGSSSHYPTEQVRSATPAYSMPTKKISSSYDDGMPASFHRRYFAAEYGLDNSQGLSLQQQTSTASYLSLRQTPSSYDAPQPEENNGTAGTEQTGGAEQGGESGYFDSNAFMDFELQTSLILSGMIPNAMHST
ncbi:hypothetical protein B0A55_13521, partial [Friedmanniomyces simplex]